MESMKPSMKVSMMLSTVLLVVLFSAKNVQGQEPEVTSDFFIPVGVNESTINSSYFTFTGLRDGTVSANQISTDFFTVIEASRSDIVALTGLGVSIAKFYFGPGAIGPPHIHPRGTELLYLLQGTLTVGLVDSTNKLYSQTLQEGDLFVFPEGLAHFQVNYDNSSSSVALVAFSSSDPGVLILAPNLFASGISDPILEKSFNASAVIVDALETEFGTANVSAPAPSSKI